MEEVKQFVNLFSSEIYQKAIDFIKSKMSILVDENYDIFFSEIDSGHLLKANVSIDEMENIICTDFENVVRFAMAKIEKYEKESDDGGEFPEGEGLGEDEAPIEIAPSKLVLSFLLMYSVEYYILKNNPNGLMQYIKDRKIPNAKKYKKELKEIYNNIK